MEVYTCTYTMYIYGLDIHVRRLLYQNTCVNLHNIMWQCHVMLQLIAHALILIGIFECVHFYIHVFECVFLIFYRREHLTPEQIHEQEVRTCIYVHVYMYIQYMYVLHVFVSRVLHFRLQWKSQLGVFCVVPDNSPFHCLKQYCLFHWPGCCTWTVLAYTYM